MGKLMKTCKSHKAEFIIDNYPIFLVMCSKCFLHWLPRLGRGAGLLGKYTGKLQPDSIIVDMFVLINDLEGELPPNPDDEACQ